MKFISSYRAERSVAQFLQARSIDSPGARKAADVLRKLGSGAVPTIIEALSTADKKQSTVLVQALCEHVSDVNFRLFAAGLGHTDQRCVKGVASALAASNGYTVSRLVELLSNEGVSKPAVIEVLRSKKSQLEVSKLLRSVYDLGPGEKAAMFNIIMDIATDESVPGLIDRLAGKDTAVRVHIIDVLSRFNRPHVAAALQKQLADSNKGVRQATLAALMNMEGQLDIEAISKLLMDPDMAVQNKAVDLLVKMRHPETMKYLLEVLKDESEYARRSAVEVLNEVADPSSIRHLLAAIEDEDWWVRSRAADALATIGGPKVRAAVLELIRDKDENVRRAAIEILNQTKDEQAVDDLICALDDDDWWVRERASDALGEIGDMKAVPALVKMLQGESKSVPAAVRALGRLGDHKIAPHLVVLLNREEKEIRIEAVNALSKLANETMVTGIRAKLEPLVADTDPTIAKVAGDAIARIAQRFSATTIEADRKALLMAEPEHTLLVEDKPAKELAQAAGKDLRLDVSKLKAGDTIESRYKYLEKIGKGAFGTVVLVEDTVVDEQLILKFLNPNVSEDAEMMQRFVHELRYSRKITHPNVIRIYDFVSLSGNYAISMEYFKSHTLGAEIAKQKPMPTDKALNWGADIANGMMAAHEVGIVHRDLKPANILINDEGILKVVDFGVAAAAKTEDTQLTKTGYVIGSPKYMAPEQILGKAIDFRADIYSLGVLLYEMLTGSPPYTKGDHMSVMYQHIQAKAKLCEELNPDIPANLAALVKKAMEVDKHKRYETMEALRDALVEVS
jgi:HEAT repeat protein/tRNA A-37 threonylcarbamoyl transferase component Bud32